MPKFTSSCASLITTAFVLLVVTSCGEARFVGSSQVGDAAPATAGGPKAGAAKASASELTVSVAGNWCEGSRLTQLPFANSNESGTGTVGNPWRICTLEQLDSIRDTLGGFFKLAADINASSTSTFGTLVDPDGAPNSGDEYYSGWDPIGTSTTPFTGTFDGSDFTISGLYINRPTSTNVGFFGHASATSVLHNVKLLNANIKGADNVGALVGYNLGSVYEVSTSGATVSGANSTGGVAGWISGATASVTDSYAENVTVLGSALGAGGVIGKLNLGATTTRSWSSGTITCDPVTGQRCGGLVGFVKTGTVTYSYSSATVSGYEKIGGLAGYLYPDVAATEESIIEHSHATGNVSVVSTSGYAAGGLVGAGGNGTRIYKSYATGNVTNAGTAVTVNMGTGGLIGWVNWSTAARINDCYATGNVTSSNSKTGGLIGYGDSLVINNSYATGNVTGAGVDTGGLIGRFTTGQLYNSFSTGSVTSTNATGLGGLVGTSANSYTWIRNSAWFKPSGSTLSCIGATSSTAPNKVCYVNSDVNDFTVASNVPLSSWDFTTIWTIPGTGMLPKLRD